MKKINDEYLYSTAHGDMCAPLRVNEHVAKKLQNALASKSSDTKSCIRKIDAIWCDGKFMLGVEFNRSTKCTTGLKNPSSHSKTEMCFKRLCNGRCTDDFMRNVVAKNILPELYNTKQK